MRVLPVVLAAMAVSVASAGGHAVGDPPRTFSHYMNAESAALCRANAAAGGLSAFFFNPAAVSEVTGASGYATTRINIKKRDYLQRVEPGLDGSDDGFLLSQFAAAKRVGFWVVGFGYSCPSYWSLDLSGSSGDVSQYSAEFRGGLMFFEAIAATRIGRGDRAGIGVSVGVSSLSESFREVADGSLTSADLSGMGASVCAGFVLDVTDRLTVGAGHRWGSTISVRGEWFRQERETGESHTVPAYVLGMRLKALRGLTLHGSYLVESWDKASSTLAAYEENGGDRDEFSEPIAMAALGIEGRLFGDRLTVRAGAARQVAADIGEGIVPETALGGGASYSFGQYSLDVALVRERFMHDGRSGKMTAYGIYAAVGYVF